VCMLANTVWLDSDRTPVVQTLQQMRPSRAARRQRWYFEDAKTDRAGGAPFFADVSLSTPPKESGSCPLPGSYPLQGGPPAGAGRP
jgi:hypothetical protein